MPSIRFANVLMEITPRALSYPTMYYHTNQPVRVNPDTHEWFVEGAGTIDFTTYFNSLSTMKLLKYTRATGFHLHLEVKGSACTITQTKAYRLSSSPEIDPTVFAKVQASNKWQSIDLDLTVDENMVLAGFQIETTGAIVVRDAYYTLDIDGELTDIELSLSTTTFKKESYITKNIELVKKEILGSDNDIAKHFRMHVIDNGCTLPYKELSTDKVTISPNENVGGAGGFARGMIESMEQDVPATHVLLMDDDVEVSPESIMRTYNLLRIVKPEYSEAFVSGAMLNYEDVQDMKEDTGFIDPQIGICVAAKIPLQVTKFVDIVFNEVYDENLRVGDGRRYAAWWYCCIPMSVIKRNGMPLPVFVRYDDVEYGIRCNPTFMTMNGLCIWHSKFEIRYNAAVERYQSIRNGMIAQMTTGLAPSIDTFLRELHDQVDLELKKFNYTDAELALKGFEDFLKGPDFIKQPIVQEKFVQANQEKEKLVSFPELQQMADDMGLEGFDVSKLTRQEIDNDKPRSIQQRAFDFLTINGQRLLHSSIHGAKGTPGKRYALISSAGWIYPAGSIHGENIIIAIDWFNRRGTIRTKNLKQYNAVTKRYKRDLAYFKKNRERLSAEYKAASKELTSIQYWKQYLGMK